MCRKAAERRSLRLFCGKNRHFGPSDWFRTSGLVVPNHALYHLSYTRIFSFLLLSLWSKMWSNGDFRRSCRRDKVPKRQRLQGVAGFAFSGQCRGCYTLPKQARYQLRYTRLFSLFIRLVVFSQPGAIPTSLYPDIHFSAMIPRQGRKSKIFLSVVIYVVKAAFVPFSATGGNPANAGVARLCGVFPCPVPDTATALPNAARYQLRYTPIVIKLWSCKWSNLWSNTFLTAIFCFPYRPKIARLKGFRRLAPINVRNAVYAPKPPALPTALHPVMKFPPLETTHASDLTFILYINTVQSAIFFSARLPRQSYYCAEGSDAADAASEPSAEAAPYKSKPSFFSLFRTADVLRLISAAISLIGTALLHMSAARSSCS